ncbi:MAG: hypothetical protein FWE86_04685 [Oscillospiraceae bacterium]|nr:hypothetical protein [Oscillospiraceae bacterium]
MKPKAYAYAKSRFLSALMAVLFAAAFAFLLSRVADSADAVLGAGTARRIIPRAEEIAAIFSSFHPMSVVRRLLCLFSPYAALLAESLWSVVKWAL